MTYTIGSIIEDTDYNGFAVNAVNTNVNDIWATGGDQAYGQTALSTVSVGSTVTARLE